MEELIDSLTNRNESMEEVADISKRLNRASVKGYYSPYNIIEWTKAIDVEEWFFSPELMSIYGTDIYNQLSEEQLKQLSLYETLNFFSLNIHGEKYLISNMATYLYRNWSEDIYSYLHHFIDEENKHMTLFGEFCQRYGKIYPEKKLSFSQNWSEEQEELLFFVRMMIFEELVDYFNEKMGRDERLNPIAKAINLNHHRDETRHLVFGRKVIEFLLDKGRSIWSEQEFQDLEDYIKGYFQATWREYYNPYMYQDAGIGQGYQVYELVWDNPAAIQRRAEASDKCLGFLSKVGLIKDKPEVCYGA